MGENKRRGRRQAKVFLPQQKGCRDGSEDHLTFDADIPKACPEGEEQPAGAKQQGNPDRENMAEFR